MSTEPQCPKCQSEYTYADGNLWICPSCAHEWAQSAASSSEEAIEVQDLAMCRAVRGSAVCVDLANAERDAGRLVKSLAGLVAAGALPASVMDVAWHLADALEGAAILAGA